MRKKILEKRLARLEAKKKNLNERCAASTDAAEVRGLTAELEEVNAEIAETREELDAINAEETREAAPLTPPANATLVNGRQVGSFVTPAAPAAENRQNPTESMEYRMAFMRFVQTGEIAPELRGDAINTGDVAPAIPLTVMRQVINTVRLRFGNLYNRVRKLNIRGGVEFPIGSLRATFRWINESTVSPRQKLDPLAKVMFSYHTAEIRVAQTFLSSILTIEEFESQIAEVIAIAYLEAMDYGIVRGSGNGTMLGILNDPRVAATGNVVELTAADMGNWTAWRKKFFAKLPLGYRAGEFIFPLSTVETYLETMADSNNNPIFRQATGLEVNDGDAQNPSGRFFGRAISLVEPEILPDFDTASDGDVIGIFWQPQEYAINENFGFTMRRYFDEETNEWVNKALVVVDGKTLNPYGFWLIKKKVPA